MKFTVAAVQAGSIPFDALATAKKAVPLIAEASKNGAKLALFPEAFLGGYTRGSTYGAPVGMRSPEGRDAYLHYFNNAITLDGAETRMIGNAARKHNIYVTMGVLEKTHSTVYCTVLFWDNTGQLMGKHRKLMPIGGERLIWGSGDGSTLPVFETPLGRMGAVICWENYMPLLRMYMYNKGITLYCAPTADDKDNWVSTMRHIAIEGRCFVISACQYILRSAYPDKYECLLGNSPDLIISRGGSVILDPLGNILAGPDFSGETLLFAEIDTSQVIRGKFDLDVTGHCSRPDIFQLHVNISPQVSVLEETRTRLEPCSKK